MITPWSGADTATDTSMQLTSRALLRKLSLSTPLDGSALTQSAFARPSASALFLAASSLWSDLLEHIGTALSVELRVPRAQRVGTKVPPKFLHSTHIPRPLSSI